MSHTPEKYQFGSITIAGNRYTQDLIILPEQVVPNWWREEGHLLQPGDLTEVFETQSEVLVVGTGAYGRMQVAESTRQALAEAGIRLVAQPTGQAVETYNRLVAEGEGPVSLAVHLTC